MLAFLWRELDLTLGVSEENLGFFEKFRSSRILSILTSFIFHREPAALTQLVTLFVTRNYPLWKEPEVAEWLERNVRELLKGVTAEEDIVSQNRDK